MRRRKILTCKFVVTSLTVSSIQGWFVRWKVTCRTVAVLAFLSFSSQYPTSLSLSLSLSLSHARAHTHTHTHIQTHTYVHAHTLTNFATFRNKQLRWFLHKGVLVVHSTFTIGVVINVFDYDILVSEFKPQFRYYVYFRTNIFGKGMKPLTPPAIG